MDEKRRGATPFSPYQRSRGGCLKLIHDDLINQHVTVAVELGRNLPLVTGDPVQLQQVLLNLVVNACDAMTNCDAPERRLLIRTGTQTPNGNSAVLVSVTDRGGSIPEEKMEQIFEPFFTTKAKGMGLGLSVCHTIIAAIAENYGPQTMPTAARRSISAFLSVGQRSAITNH